MSSQRVETIFWKPLGHGIHSVVWGARRATVPTDVADPVDDLRSNWVAIKVVRDNRSIPPHDIVREAAILQNLRHPNIISLVAFIQNLPQAPFALYMPLIPVPLTTILSSPLFSPFPITGPYSALSRPILAPYEGQGGNPYNVVIISIVYQLILAIAYLHSLDPPIAHRDINPGNVLVDHEGTVKLIDFGIAWSTPDIFSREPGSEPSESHPYDMWTETTERMCCEVTTGPYRPPELLFSPRSYSATAVDLWSLGTTIAQFFTSLRLVPSHSPQSSPGSEASDETEDLFTRPFLISSSLRAKIDYRAAWERVPLFDGSQGELALVWSIFKLRGTPNEEIWPTFKTLPDVDKLVFRQASRKPLHTVLPHLPPDWSPSHPINDNPAIHVTMDESPVSLIDSFLAYPPESRLSAAQALTHKWFSDVLLPHSHPGFINTDSVQSRDVKWVTRWEGRTLAEWLNPVIQRETNRLIHTETYDAKIVLESNDRKFLTAPPTLLLHDE